MREIPCGLQPVVKNPVFYFLVLYCTVSCLCSIYAHTIPPFNNSNSCPSFELSSSLPGLLCSVLFSSLSQFCSVHYLDKVDRDRGQNRTEIGNQLANNKTPFPSFSNCTVYVYDNDQTKPYQTKNLAGRTDGRTGSLFSCSCN